LVAEVFVTFKDDGVELISADVSNGAMVVFDDATDEFVFELVAVGNEPDVEFIVLLISTVAKVLSIPELDGLAL
jgi:hypothetical protein